jgi:hypothetical protein
MQVSGAKRVLDAWERAHRHAYSRASVDNRIMLEEIAGITRAHRDTKDDPGILLSPCTQLSLNTIRETLEEAILHTYSVGNDFLVRGSYSAKAILAVGLVEQLDRLDYETGLALRAIAVQDAWDLANKGDISTEHARESAQDDNCKAAKARLEMAKAEGFTTAMGGLQMGEENREFEGEQKLKYAWRVF